MASNRKTNVVITSNLGLVTSNVRMGAPPFWHEGITQRWSGCKNRQGQQTKHALKPASTVQPSDGTNCPCNAEFKKNWQQPDATLMWTAARRKVWMRYLLGGSVWVEHGHGIRKWRSYTRHGRQPKLQRRWRCGKSDPHKCRTTQAAEFDTRNGTDNSQRKRSMASTGGGLTHTRMKRGTKGKKHVKATPKMHEMLCTQGARD